MSESAKTADSRVDGPTIITATGRYVSPLDLRADDVCIDDIAHALAHQCRYSGHTRVFYSVAEHSVRMATRLIDRDYGLGTCLWALLHDATEAYLVDLPRPLKTDPVFGPRYREAEASCRQAIVEHFWLSPSAPEIVKQLDLTMLATERRDLLPPNGAWKILDGVAPLPERIDPWTCEVARDEFLVTYEWLTTRAGDRERKRREYHAAKAVT